MDWTVVIPVKSLPSAKSRLATASADADAHRRLVEAIRSDTVAAAAAADNVARVLLVLDRVAAPHLLGPLPAEVLTLVQTGSGLNEALRDGAAYAAHLWPADGIAALVGDLPALRADELADTLRVAATHDRGFAADASGGGTTLVTARPGHDLRPEFGIGSAARHAADAVALPAGPGLRHDVDTPADLEAAGALGFGVATDVEVAGVADRSTCSGIVTP